MTVQRVLADIVEALRTSHLEHEAIRAEMATKEHLAAEAAAIREDLARETAAIRAEMATKEDLAREVAAIRAEMATKEDLAREVAAIRAEMATKKDLACLEAAMRREFEVVHNEIRNLTLEFEAFRHDTKVTLDMIGELMARTARHEKSIARLDRRMTRVEKHLKLKPLPNDAADQ
ncbi:MAG TPA: hypothetical protein DGR79_05260 [Clostridiales bacterium]|nr:hypothetical protein [Clostridiales bacterium]